MKTSKRKINGGEESPPEAIDRSMNRLEARFGAVLDKAIRTFPWLSRVRTGLCAGCDREHAASWRQFSHACHHKDVVCWAGAAETELTDSEIDGIAAHELGHIVANELRLPAHRGVRRFRRVTERVEAEANEAAAAMGFRVIYNARTLEELTPQI